MAQPLDFGTQKQLFIDDYVLERMEGLERRVHPFLKHPRNPLLRADKPWEIQQVYLFGTVLFDAEEQCFKAWYQTYWKDPPICNVDYAVSRDGLNWEKPPLGVVEFNGSTQNNIVLTDASAFTVCKDVRDASADHRYKALYWGNNVGYSAAFSPDGVHWTPHAANPVLPGGDVLTLLGYDERQQAYVAYVRSGGPGRMVAFTKSQDFVQWETPEVVLRADERDAPDSDLYGMSPFVYEGLYLGLLWVYHPPTGRRHLELVSSRDGLHFERDPSRTPVLDEGLPGEWDAYNVLCASQPVLREDSVWLYYAGGTAPHSSPDPHRTCSIGLATLRRDGFVSLEARGSGWLITQPFVLRGSALTLHAQVLDGALKVGLLDAEGCPLPGWEVERGDPFRGDSRSHLVTWAGQSDLSSLVGQTVRLHVWVENGRVYAFQVQP